jgi:hypothetical protein
MSPSRLTFLAVGPAALGFAIAASGLAIAFDPWGQSQWSYMKGAEAVPALADNQGVYVDKGTFKLTIGAAKGADPVALITKMGGKEVANGAVIFRSGDKLYIVDGKPAGSN